jgi:xylulokinase
VDVRTHTMADELVALAHVTRSANPPKMASHQILGRVTPKAAAETGLSAGTPVVGVAADLIASALCAGVIGPGDVLLKFGGSIDVLVATDNVAPDARMYLDYHLVPGLFMPNGCMSTGGSGLDWFAATFAGNQAAAEQGLSLDQQLDRRAEAIPPGAEGVRVLPYFLGEKTPIHDPRRADCFPVSVLLTDLGISGVPCSRPMPKRLLTTSRYSTTWVIEPRTTSSATAARRAASGCRSSPTSCSGRCNGLSGIPGPASVRPGQPSKRGTMTDL